MSGKETNYEYIFQNIVDGINIVDAETKRFSMSNRALSLMLGYDETEMPDLRVYDIHPKEAFPRIDQLFDALLTRKITIAKDVPVVRKDGTLFYADITASPMEFDGRPHLLATFRDETERKRAEEEREEAYRKVRAAEERLSAFIDRAAIAIAISKDKVLTFVNTRFLRMFGYDDPSEIVGRPVFDLLPLSEHEKIRQVSISTSANPLVIGEVETMATRRDGSRFWIHAALSNVYDYGTLGFITDITDRKTIEQDLARNEELLRITLDTTADGIVLADNERKIIHANRKYLDMWDIPSPLPADFDDRYLVDRIVPMIADPDRFMKRSEELYRGQDTSFEEIRLLDGRVLERYTAPFIVNEKQYGRIWDFRDITKRKQAEEEARKSEAILVSLFNATPMGIGLLVDDVFVKLNESLYAIVGLSYQDLQEHTSAALFESPEYHEETMRELYGQMARKGLGITECRLARRDGTFADVILCLSPFDLSDISAGVTMTVLDISERKKMADEKGRLEEMLIRSQKMEALGTMAGGIAHDFNNILSGIFGYSELASMVRGNPEKTNGYIDEILKSAERARDLISRILTFSRQSEPELKPVIPKYVIKEALKLQRALTPRGIEIETVFDSDSAVMADPTMLHQMILNLCNNSVYAMEPNPGVLKVTLEEITADEEFTRRHPGLRTGKYVLMRVSDTGHGMPKEICDHIFEPFFTTKPQGEGTGLGLSVVHGIVKKLNGNISVYSVEGEGTVFNILLPAIEKGEKEIDRSDSLIRGGTERVLLIDDEEAIINSIGIILENLGYSVTTFSEYGEALDAFARNPDAYDIVITDYSMPGMNGIEIARRIREIRSDLPVILNSGYVNMQLEEAAVSAGISAILSKPVSTYRLADAIRKALF